MCLAMSCHTSNEFYLAFPLMGLLAIRLSPQAGKSPVISRKWARELS